METPDNGMLSGPCRYCFEWSQNGDGICEDCLADIRIAEKIEGKKEEEGEIICQLQGLN